MNPLPRPPLLVITDRGQARRPLVPLAAAAFEAGCRWLLLREKDLDPDSLRALLGQLTELAAEFDALVLVSGDVAAAIDCRAAGVHLPAGGDPAAARRALGTKALIGYSHHGLDDCQAAIRAGVDYLTLSPVFQSPGKPGYGPALGPEGLGGFAMRCSVPVLALAGVTAGNARACMEAGAAGVAVMGAVMGAADPGHAVADLVAAIAST